MLVARCFNKRFCLIDYDNMAGLRSPMGQFWPVFIIFHVFPSREVSDCKLACERMWFLLGIRLLAIFFAH